MSAEAEGEPYSLDVTVALGRDGRSRLARRAVRHPWSLGRAFAFDADPGAATLVPQAAGAGLLGGDVQRQRVRVEAGASARLVAAGATMVYASRAGGVEPASETLWRFEIGPDATLLNVAEPFRLHGPATLRARQVVALAEGARCVTWEGLVASEDPDCGWTSDIVVEGPDGAPLLRDVQTVAPGALALQRRLAGGLRAFGAVYALGPPSDRAALLRAVAPWAGVAAPGAAAADALAASAPLRGGLGVGLRVAAVDGGALRAACSAAAARLADALTEARLLTGSRPSPTRGFPPASP